MESTSTEIEPAVAATAPEFISADLVSARGEIAHSAATLRESGEELAGRGEATFRNSFHSTDSEFRAPLRSSQRRREAAVRTAASWTANRPCPRDRITDRLDCLSMKCRLTFDRLTVTRSLTPVIGIAP
jgi:hypothetical protein